MPKMNGSRACIEALRREGVNVVFGLPGGAVMPFYDELIDSGIRHILVRHEQCAAHMADGFARSSGRTGVCIATSGPGATNLVTGIATAFMDSSPIVALTANVPTHMLGTEAFQEADIISITASITKKNFQLMHPSQIPTVFHTAFRLASSGRPGPVLIDIPKDVQTIEEEIEFPEGNGGPIYEPLSPPADQVKEAVQVLLQAERPLILVGGGAKLSNATPELVALAEKLVIPVATTFLGKGSMPENHQLALGTIGMHGRPYTNVLITEADVILAVGCRFSDRSTSSKEFARRSTIIHVDVDSSEVSKSTVNKVPLIGDAKRAMMAILHELNPASHNLYGKWMKRVEEVKTSFVPLPDDSSVVRPPRFLRELRQLLPVDTIVTTDVGQHQMWASLFFDAYYPKAFLSSAGLGTMGFGFPAALGAKVANPKTPVMCLTGEGSFLMTEQELATSIEEHIPVIVVILNNRCLGMVAQWQRTFYGGRYSAVDLGKSPDFVKLAEAFGAEGVRVESYNELPKIVREALSNEVTTVIDVPISPEEDVYPFVIPGKPLDTPLLGKEYERKT